MRRGGGVRSRGGENRAVAAAAAPCGETEIRGARMLQHAEREVSAVDSDDWRSVDFVHGHPWLSTPTVGTIRHDPHGCPWTKSKERMVSAVDFDDWRSVDFVHGHPSVIDSDDQNLPTRHARVPLDEVQGTGGVSRRLRRLAFRGLRPRAPLVVDSGDPNRPTRHARVPLDEVQGTGGVSRRLRRLAFRGLRPRAPLVVDSGDLNHPTRHARVPLDEVQGTGGVSRRLRRLAFRGLRPRAPLVVDSHGRKHPTRHARVPLDEVQGTGDVRLPTPTIGVPWTSSTGTLGCRLRRSEPSDTTRTGALGRSPRNG